MSASLKLAPMLSVPDDAVTQRLAFLGRIGSGKSYAATKLAELLYDAGAQFIALDPVGVWYGLRVPGTGKALDIPVFGGLHGDVPLEATAGAMIADLVVDRGLSCILDVSQFESDADKARFAAAFAKRFFFRKKAAPSAVHIFLEECQEFIPQNPQRDEAMMLHEWTRLAKLGRNFGIGLSLITQRPQEVSKKVLNLTECLFAFQMTGSHERKAIRDWASDKGADTKLVDILPVLPVGDAHVWSPQWLQVSKRVKVYPKRTADVSSTPTLGAAARVDAKPLQAKDLEALRVAMAESVERHKADDPKELRKRIAELEREKAKVRTVGPTHEEVQAQIQESVRRIMREHSANIAHLERNYAKEISGITELVTKLHQHAGDALGMLDMIQKRADNPMQALVLPTFEGGAVIPPLKSVSVEARGESLARTYRKVKGDLINGGDLSGSSELTKGQQKILNALAEMAALNIHQPSRTQLGLFAGMGLTGGSGGQSVADLVTAGLLTIPNKGAVELSPSGASLATAVDAPRSLHVLHGRVLAKLSSGQHKILSKLLELYPEATSRKELGDQIGMGLTGGSGGQSVADLVTLGVARIPAQGKVAAADILFPRGLR